MNSLRVFYKFFYGCVAGYVHVNVQVQVRAKWFGKLPKFALDGAIHRL